jgi:hypothetical protein
MKTTIGKALAVATAVASLAFLGFAGVSTFGGPNWEGRARSIEGYTFSRTEGENPQWTVKKHVGDVSVPANKNLAPLIAQVYDDKKKDADEELAKLTAREPLVKAEIEALGKSTVADLAAMDARAADYRKYLDQLRKDVEALAAQVDMKAADTQKLEQRIEARREDVLRLSAQLEELRADGFRIGRIQQQLKDLIQQLDGSLERARRREAQLKGY